VTKSLFISFSLDGASNPTASCPLHRLQSPAIPALRRGLNRDSQEMGRLSHFLVREECSPTRHSDERYFPRIYPCSLSQMRGLCVSSLHPSAHEADRDLGEIQACGRASSLCQGAIQAVFEGQEEVLSIALPNAIDSIKQFSVADVELGRPSWRSALATIGTL